MEAARAKWVLRRFFLSHFQMTFPPFMHLFFTNSLKPRPSRIIRRSVMRAPHSKTTFRSAVYLLVAGQPAVDGGVDDPVEAHGEGVDVLHLPALALRDQRAQLQVLVLDHLDGVLQRAHLHL